VKQLGVKRKRSTTPFEPLSPMGFDEAVRYVNEVKTRYAATPDVYNQFIEALDSLQTLQTLESLGSLQMGGRAEQKIRETHSKIVDLFENEPDLIERLNSFLPVSSEQDVRRVAQTTNSQNSETRHRIMVRDLKSNLKAVAEMHNMVTRMKSIIFHIYKSPSIDHRLTRLLRTCEKIMARYETATPKKSELSEEIESTFNVKDRTLNDDDFRDMIAHMTTSMVLSFGIWVQFPGDVHIEEEEEG
jgi:histone deacetylase complex regulatory component SIN3